MPASLLPSSILLIEPAPAFREIVYRYFLAVRVDVCTTFEKAVRYMPLNLYQVVICPQNIASRDGYSLLSLNRLHHPSSPFIITTEREEVADVRQAIEHGALGFIHGTTTTSNIISIVEGLMALYRLRASLDDRMKWATNYRVQLRKNLTHGKSRRWSGNGQENRMTCKQSLSAIEDSMRTFRAKANILVSEARQRMWDAGF